MLRKFLSLTVVAMMAVLLVGCSPSEETESTENTEVEMVTYESQTGPVEVPAEPQRVVVLSSFTGNVMSLGVEVVGCDPYAKESPYLSEELEDVPVVSENDVEAIAALEPDLIIGLSTTQNIDQLEQIAPVVTYEWGVLDYKEQHIEIGKLLGKEEEAIAWVEDFEQRCATIGAEVQAVIGEDATVTVMENWEKEMYIYGENFGHGTEILYTEMGLKMPEKVSEATDGVGYAAVSLEVLHEYVGDYLIFSQNSAYDTSFTETDLWNSMPAVQNGNVLVVDSKGFLLNDPISLDAQLALFEDFFLGE